MKKTTSFMASALALTVLAAGAANAQTVYETRSVSTTETNGDVTTSVNSQYVSSTTMMPSHVGDAPASSTETAVGSVKVKLPSGEVISVSDSDETPWRKDSRLTNYDRFTFDADSGAFVAGSGDAKYANNWDDNGNRIMKKAPAPKKKKVVKKAEVTEETTTTEEAPAVEAPASEAPAGDVPAEVPAQ